MPPSGQHSAEQRTCQKTSDVGYDIALGIHPHEYKQEETTRQPAEGELPAGEAVVEQPCHLAG